MDYTLLKEKFIEQINSANNMTELATIEKNQYDEISELVKAATGYKYPNEVPPKLFKTFQRDRRKILEVLNTDNEMYHRKQQISPAHIADHDSSILSKKGGGKKCKTRRNKKSKKNTKSKSRKNRIRSNR